MHERSARLLRGLAALAFTALSIAVAAYAFAYLYREHPSAIALAPHL
jgi:hypothetical protein